MTRSWLILACLALSCTGTTDDFDRDGDGFPNFDDCAPDEALAFPGAEEVCDGVDNDCDGEIDEEVTGRWYADLDGDGFGADADFVDGCPTDIHALDLGGDCDDGNDARNPNGSETCNGVDDDCDGDTDEPLVQDDFAGVFDVEQAWVLGSASRIDELYNNGVEEVDNGTIRLTSDENGNAGAIWFTEQVPGDSFSVSFEMRIESANAFTTGEGFAFAFYTGTNEDVLGNPGVRLGILRQPVDGLSIEFDPFGDGENDSTTTQRHVAVHDIRTGTRLVENTSPPAFTNTTTYLPVTVTVEGIHVTVDFNGTIVVDEDMPSEYTPHDSVRVGFTAATSDARKAAHYVDNIVIGCNTEDEADSGDTGQ